MSHPEAVAQLVATERSLLRTVIDNVPDLIFVKDTAGRFLVANSAVVQLLGANCPEAVANKTDADYFPPALATRFRADDEQVMQSGRPLIGREETFLDPAGNTGWLETTKVPLRDGASQIVGVVGISRNITQRKQTEEQLARQGQELAQSKKEAERANHAKSEFLSRMSHELRTPLNAILGFAQILEMGSLDADERASVEQIIKGGRHLLTLINEVLDIARIETGRLPLSLEPVLLREALKEALDLVLPLATARNLTLTGVPTDHIWKRHIRADRQRFKQVLLNLLSNAIKYNREGGSVKIDCKDGDADHVRLEVMDTGPGIPQDKMHLLFNPFERLGAEQTGVEGAGIGLALCQRLVEAMGGQIGATSDLGRGSTFWLELPVTEGPLEQLERSSCEVLSRTTPNGPNLKTRSVLYVEDNLSNCRLMERILASRPEVRLITAMQGRLGLELARERAPDLILLDVHLPDMSGLDVLHSLQMQPGTRSIPVVMLSADATKRQMDRLLAAGAQAYLTKPLDIKKLMQFIDRNVEVKTETETSY